MFSSTKFLILLGLVLLCSCSAITHHQSNSCQVLFGIREKIFGEESFLTARSANELGECYYRQGNYNNAKAAFQRAQSIYGKLGKENSNDFAKTITNLGVVYHEQGHYEQAQQAYENALTFWKTNSTPSYRDYKFLAMSNLGALYNDLGLYARAQPLLQNSLALSETSGRKEQRDVILTNLAFLSQMLGKYDQAEQFYQQALEIQRDVSKNRSQIATIKNHLALLYHLQGNYVRAQQQAEEALKIQRRVSGENHLRFAANLTTLARIYRDQGHYERAEPLFKQAQTIYEAVLDPSHPYIALNWNEWAKLYQAQGYYTRAEPLVQKAFFIITRTEHPELLWRIQDNFSQLLASQKQINAAIWFGKQAVNTIETLRHHVNKLDDKTLQLSFLEDKKDVYRRLADLLIEQGRLPEAQQVLAMLKEEEYFDFIRHTRGRDTPDTRAKFSRSEQPWAQRYQEIKPRLVQLGQEYEKLITKEQREGLNPNEEQRLEQLIADLEIARQQFLAFFDQLKTNLAKTTVVSIKTLESLQETLAKLGTGTVLIHYVVTIDKLHIILTTPQNIINHTVKVRESELNQNLSEFRKAIQEVSKISHPDVDTLQQKARKLYQWLIQPLAHELEQAQAQVLMMYLDKALRYLPFAALYDGNQWLAERYALAIYTAASTANLSNKARFDWKVAGLGVSEARPGFAALPAVENELEGIIHHNPQDKDGVLEGVIYLNNNFDQKILSKAIRNFPAVHIASHFKFTPGTDEDSYLLLGTGNKLSLSAFNRVRFDFRNLDLFTLSACNTAMGDVENGSEVEGLGALVQRRGAKSILATLWSINDASTSALMRHFYRTRVQAHLSKARALQQTQLTFIQAGQTNSHYPKYYAHPFYWAPFILIGNWL